VQRRLLAVHAHPDDESSKGAATYAHYVGLGDQVLVVSCTGGERGDVQNEALRSRAMADRDMAGLRRIEMAEAQSIVGFEHRWLGYQDSGLPEHGEPLEPGCFALVPLEVAVEPLVRIIREFRPHVLITYDENGGYPHPDHIRAHELAMAAYRAASDPTAYAGTGAPWSIAKVYYDRIFNLPRTEAVHQALRESGHPRAEQFAELVEWMSRHRDPAEPDLATTHVPVAEHLDRRDAALRAHASQVAPDDAFFFWPNDVLAQVWPFEDFQLVESSVETTLPEHDLFAGLTEKDLR
jgi:mycothiol S-conjugate amidase